MIFDTSARLKNMVALNVIILFGSIQGLISSLILFLQKDRKLSNKLLAGIILLLSLACLNFFLMLSGLPDQYSFIETLGYFLPLTLAMPLGPLLYFYQRSINEPRINISKLHFITVLIDLLPYSLGFCFIMSRWLGMEDQRFVIYMDVAHTYVDIPRWLSLSIYLTFATRTFLMNKEIPNRGYLRIFLSVFVGFQILWLLHLVPYVVPSTRNALMDLVNWYPVYVPLAALVYFVSIYGLLFQWKLKVKSKLGTVDHNGILKKISEAMTRDFLFTRPDLTVEDVARHLALPQKQISAAINQHLGKSFNEFVNAYRIDEVKKRIGNPEYAHLTLTGLAFDCGFNSQATFQRVFKQVTNQTPGQFKRSVQQTTA